MAPASDLVPWFQMASTVITGIGVIVSTALGISSLNNNRRERQKKIEPNLVFHTGGHEINCQLEKRMILPGISREDSIEFLESKTYDYPFICALQTFGRLVNYGEGPALDTYVWFQTKGIKYSDKFELILRNDADQPPYNRDWNLTPAVSALLKKDESTSIARLPTPVFIANPATNSIDGVYWIDCKDVNGKVYRWSQEAVFHIIIRTEDEVQVVVTFGSRTP